MSEWIDITMPLSEAMTLWPGFDPPSVRHVREFEDGFRSISSVFSSNLHNGTHVDAPLHFIPGGTTVESLPIEPFIGPAVVLDATDVDRVTAEVLEDRVPAGAERVLLKTRNSLRRLAGDNAFHEDFVALTTDAAHWAVEMRLKLIANDFPSIAIYKGDSEIHLALMRAGVAILEGIILEHVEPGRYELVCLPLLIEGAEGSLARAVLRAV